MKKLAKRDLAIKDFPPKLRKLADYLIANVEYDTIKEGDMTCLNR
jgi:hypothetical protein